MSLILAFYAKHYILVAISATDATHAPATTGNEYAYLKFHGKITYQREIEKYLLEQVPFRFYAVLIISADYAHFWLKSNEPSKKCTQIKIRRDEESNTLKMSATTSMECNRKSSVVCSLDASKYTLPQRPSKFPCLEKDSKERVKRSDEAYGGNFSSGKGQGKKDNNFMN